SAGNFTLNATVTGSEISNSTVNVTDNITLTAVTTTGASGVYLKNANLTSQNGSIVANGNSTANGVATHLDGNVTLTASNGNITLTGSRVQVKNSNISAGNFTLNATVTGSEISNSTVNVT
ncbi:filamentous hemagglutinin, partial [Escherichia coli]|nr:filamentous hemagglutinin [Escherichia coli]